MRRQDAISLASDRLTTTNFSNVAVVVSPNPGASGVLPMLQKADAKGAMLGGRSAAAMRHERKMPPLAVLGKYAVLLACKR
jgi:UDP-N-acetylmuramoylalanine-D-glutamate ligase